MTSGGGHRGAVDMETKIRRTLKMRTALRIRMLFGKAFARYWSRQQSTEQPNQYRKMINM
eukprot:661785-Amorphochlora_amoeboformis.AAC.1